MTREVYTIRQFDLKLEELCNVFSGTILLTRYQLSSLMRCLHDGTASNKTKVKLQCIDSLILKILADGIFNAVLSGI